MRFLKVLLPVLVFGILAFTPHLAFAAEATFFGPIIPPECHCDGSNGQPASAPDFKCVLAVMQNLVNFAISIGVIIFVLVCAYAGFLFMFSSVNAENKSKAKNILTNAVVGLLLALAAWLLVDFIMKTLYNERWGPWNSILGDGGGSYCLAVRTPPERSGTAGGDGGGVETVTPTPGTPTTPTAPSTIAAGSQVECDRNNDGQMRHRAVVTAVDGNTLNVRYVSDQSNASIPAARCRVAGGTTGGSPTGCTNCIRVTVAHKSPSQNGCDLNGGQMGVQPPNPAITGCYVNSALHQKLQNGLSTGWWVTEMWPPTLNHRASCHGNGTCVDVSDTGSGNPDTQQIINAANRLKAQGLYVVYESSNLTTAQCQEIREATGNSNQVKLMRIGSAPHFSVYVNDAQQSGLCQ